MSDKGWNPLGFVSMPEGYELVPLDSGHWIWVHTETEMESSIHWNKWAIYHGAKAHNSAAMRAALPGLQEQSSDE